MDACAERACHAHGREPAETRLYVHVVAQCRLRVVAYASSSSPTVVVVVAGCREGNFRVFQKLIVNTQKKNNDDGRAHRDAFARARTRLTLEGTARV